MDWVSRQRLSRKVRRSESEIWDGPNKSNVGLNYAWFIYPIPFCVLLMYSFPSIWIVLAITIYLFSFLGLNWYYTNSLYYCLITDERILLSKGKTIISIPFGQVRLLEIKDVDNLRFRYLHSGIEKEFLVENLAKHYLKIAKAHDLLSPQTRLIKRLKFLAKKNKLQFKKEKDWVYSMHNSIVVYQIDLSLTYLLSVSYLCSNSTGFYFRLDIERERDQLRKKFLRLQDLQTGLPAVDDTFLIASNQPALFEELKVKIDFGQLCELVDFQGGGFTFGNAVKQRIKKQSKMDDLGDVIDMDLLIENREKSPHYATDSNETQDSKLLYSCKLDREDVFDLEYILKAVTLPLESTLRLGKVLKRFLDK